MDGWHYGWRADSLENLTNSSGHEWTQDSHPTQSIYYILIIAEKYDNYDVFLYDLEKNKNKLNKYTFI